MLLSLSGFARRHLELRTDGKIADADKAELRIIENWERVRRNEIGAVESARLALRAAMHDVEERAAVLRGISDLGQYIDMQGWVREQDAEARQELIAALDWVDHCTLEYRNALRKEGGQS
jgi:uncharacterized protein with von Willebrand factor type A (vWA) domain